MSVLEETASGIESLIEVWHPRFLTTDSVAAQHKPSDDRWSISEVVGHLVDSACNNHQRFVRAQESAELNFPKYEQNHWVRAANYLGMEWQTLVNLWYFYNRSLAHLIRSIPEDALATPCTITPLDTCTLEFLVVDYRTHLDHHLTILDDRLRQFENAS